MRIAIQMAIWVFIVQLGIPSLVQATPIENHLSFAEVVDSSQNVGLEFYNSKREKMIDPKDFVRGQSEIYIGTSKVQDLASPFGLHFRVLKQDTSRNQALIGIELMDQEWSKIFASETVKINGNSSADVANFTRAIQSLAKQLSNSKDFSYSSPKSSKVAQVMNWLIPSAHAVSVSEGFSSIQNFLAGINPSARASGLFSEVGLSMIAGGGMVLGVMARSAGEVSGMDTVYTVSTIAAGVALVIFGQHEFHGN